MSYPNTGFTATIANGAQQSGAVDMGSYALCGVFIPAAFTGVAITFQASPTLAGTYVDVQDGAGAAISKTVAAGKYIPVDPTSFAGVRFLKIKSGSAEGADRILTLAGKPR